MNTKLITLTFLLFINLAFSQNKRFNYGLNILPNYSFVTAINQGELNSEFVNAIMKNEKNKFAFSCNAFLKYNFNDKLSLISGLGFQNNGEQSGKYKVYRIVYNRNNFELMINVKYHFTKRWFGVIGVSEFYNLSNKTKSILYPNNQRKVNSNVEDKLTDFNAFNTGINIGFGYNVIHKENYRIFLQPNFQYGLFGVAKNVNLNRRFVLLGLNLGVEF